MSVTQRRAPCTQMPLGLFIVTSKARCSITLPSSATFMMNPLPSFSPDFNSVPPKLAHIEHLWPRRSRRIREM